MTAALLAAASAVAAPTLVIEAPPDGSTSHQTTPTVEGSTDDPLDPVSVSLYAGTSATGEPVQSLSTFLFVGSSWSVGPFEALPDGVYTARATQTNALEETGTSTVTFAVDTAPPTVTLNAPSSPTKDTTPSFSGTASDKTTVTVHVYNAESTEVASSTASVTGGSWSSGGANPPLADGNYTALATQKSSLGNPDGKSQTRSFTVDTSSPHVTLDAPPSPAKDTTPSFSGTASDSKSVTVLIYPGASAKGSPVASATGSGAPGSWASGGASPPLASGQYTAVATQESSLGNPEGKSEPRTFVIDTSSPHVTLSAPPSPSNHTTPSFSGTASDSTPVTVLIYSGTSASGAPVSSASATDTPGSWGSGAASPALSSGDYTAVATQESSLGNPDGKSESRTFRVDTGSPVVTLNAPPARTNDTTPSFSGSASDATTVTVHIYNASSSEVATATATGTRGAWGSGGASPPLANGSYTAVATQKSSLGNPDGTSETRSFTVDTTPPTVTLNAPAARSNNTKPSFSGTASDSMPVTVAIYAGASVKGSPVANATGTGAPGSWSSGAVTLTSGEYTAVATQKSSIGNSPGTSEARTFTIDTSSPRVALNGPPTLSNNPAPAFTGTASDTTPVTVLIYPGSSAKGTPAATATAPGTGGAWASGAASPPLADGGYTAVAVQESSLGNPAGKSLEKKFSVETAPPRVTLTAPPTRSNNTKPTFKGTATDTTTVTVHIYNAANAEVSKATAPAASAWTSGVASPALASGEYTAVATQPSSLGNPEGKSETARFVVDTAPPTVTLNPPASPSANTAPAFTGTASDPTTTVLIQIYPQGSVNPVATATAKPVKGKWASSPVTPALPHGKHTFTAKATQKSSIGNPDGTSSSVTFIVDSEAPTVTLNPPPAQSNVSQPSFTGTASDPTQVTVKIYSGPTAGPPALPVAEVNAPGTGGFWKSASVGSPLPDGLYTAVASQTSLAGHVGGSEPKQFSIDTIQPALTISSPADGASAIAASQPVEGAAGTAPGDVQSVTVRLFAADGSTGLQTIVIHPTGGRWSTTFGGLSPGSYSYRAEQADEAGNLATTPPRTFTLNGPPAAPAAPSLPPAASLTWYPAAPHTGEPVSLVSSSTDAASPITAFAWDLAGNGAFQPGGQVLTTTFSAPGGHTVRLRVTDANGLASIASATIGVTLPPAALMQPYPIVRLLTTRIASGIRLRQLTVQAPAGSRILVSCRGRLCRVKPQMQSVPGGGKSVVEFRRFQRAFRPGVIVEIRVWKPGLVGKFTRLTVRKGKPPSRFDTCLSPTGTTPIACPSS